jgi:hypothetical protein
MPRWKPEFWEHGMWNPMFHWDGRKAQFQDETAAWDFVYFCNVPLDIPVRVEPQMVVW